MSSHGGRSQGSLWSLFYSALVPFMRLHPHDLSTSQRPHLHIPSLLGIRISNYEFWRDANIQTIAITCTNLLLKLKNAVKFHSLVCGLINGETSLKILSSLNHLLSILTDPIHSIHKYWARTSSVKKTESLSIWSLLDEATKQTSKQQNKNV